MSTNNLYQQLSQLKLSGLQAALVSQLQQPSSYQELTFEERLELLLSQEINQRENRKIERLERQAKFRLKAELADIDYSASRQLEKVTVRTLMQNEWISNHQNLLITGATGCGKTWLACALGKHFCREGYSVLYFRLKELLEKLYFSQADGSYRRLINKLANSQLLILDDWGLEPLDAQQRSNLLELFDARYDTKSTIITSQIPVINWHEIIGESTHADAILDRIVHRGIKLELKGESMRKTKINLTDGDRLS